jgi:hypothetical protein
VGFITHFEVENVSAVRANRDSRGSSKQPFYIYQGFFKYSFLMLGGPQQHPNREETYFMTCTTFDLKSTPDITTPIRTIPTRIKNTPQNSVNQQHSNQQVEQSEQENIFTAFYQSTLESFLHSWENFSRFYCAATFSEFWRKIWCKIW